MATGGQFSWPSVGSSVAAYGQFFMAANTASQLALRGPIRSPRYAHLRPILDTGQDKTGIVPDEPEGDDGGYVRGGAYYAGGAR